MTASTYIRAPVRVIVSMKSIGSGGDRVPAGDQVAVPAQDGIRAYQQPHLTQHVPSDGL
jgi:hypothetical protein